MEILTSHMTVCMRHRIHMSCFKRFASSLTSYVTADQQPLPLHSRRSQSHQYPRCFIRQQPVALVHSSAALYAGKRKNTKKKLVSNLRSTTYVYCSQLGAVHNGPATTGTRLTSHQGIDIVQKRNF